MNRRRAMAVTAAVLQVAAAVVFLLLVRQNLALRRQVSARVTLAPRFNAGDRLQSVPVADVTGRPTVLDFGSTRTVLIVVDPLCESCQAAMAAAGHESGVKVLSLATVESTRTAAEKTGIAPIVYTIAGQPVPPPIAAKMRTFPQILVIDDGTVVRTCASVQECRR